jgi:putative tryptophan/tyrosine transport system substrate-binding protein
MRRREFIAGLRAAAAWPIAVRAQQPAVPVIGLLNAASAAQWADYIAGFRRGLSEGGFIEGRNVAIEYRWAEGQFDRLPALATDLIGRKVAVILACGSDAAVRAAKAATQTIPIVFTTASDPVAIGFVAGLSRPGGNATGVTMLGGEIGSKRLELLHEVVPTAKKIALMVNPINPTAMQTNIQVVGAAVRRLGLEMVVIKAGNDSEIERAFATAVQQRTAAFFVGTDAFFIAHGEQICALALRHGLPITSQDRSFVMLGGLMS